MSNELVTTGGNDLTAQMEYAKVLTTGDMLPAEYRGKPGNALIAIGLGQSMGLSPAESLYRIQVIKGKPTASAELIAANVRKAGHRLRVELGDGYATASIWRSDDPDFAHVVRRDGDWAKQMGLASQDNYKKQPVTMYSARAVTACARIACPEALYGVAYVPEEMTDFRTTEPVNVSNLTPVDEPQSVDEIIAESDAPTADDVAACTDKGELTAMWHAAGPGEIQTLIKSRAAELEATAPAEGDAS